MFSRNSLIEILFQQFTKDRTNDSFEQPVKNAFFKEFLYMDEDEFIETFYKDTQYRFKLERIRKNLYFII